MIFDHARVQWYYTKLQHAKGKKFLKAASGLSRIRSEVAARSFLDILVTRSDLDYTEKAAIAEAFASLGEVGSKYLLNEIYNEAGELQYSVVSALGHIHEKEAVPIFCFLLQETDDPIFARALGDIGSSDAIVYLREKVADTKSKCRLEAFDSLCYLAPTQNFDLMNQLVRDVNRYIRKKAAFVLNQQPAKIKDETTKLLVHVALEDWDHFVIDSVSKAESLLEIAGYEESHVMERAIDILLASSFDEKYSFLVTLISKVKTQSKIYLLDNIKAFSKSVALDVIFDLLQSDDETLRASAEKFLIRFGVSSFKDSFERLLTLKTNNLLYRTTLLNIAVRSGSKFPEMILQKLTDSDESTQLLAIEIAGEAGLAECRVAIEHILAAAKSHDLALNAVWALGSIADAKSLPSIMPWITHEDYDVRSAVYEALHLIDDVSVLEKLKAIDLSRCEDEEKNQILELIDELSVLA